MKPEQITMLFEYVHATRFIYTNGSKHPEGHIDWWMGDSRGRWEGDTLVVDVVDFNEDTWFDRAGNFHSDELHVVERFTPLDADHLTYEATIEDPKVFTRPWRMSMILYRHKERNAQLLEYDCYGFDDEFHAPAGQERPAEAGHYRRSVRLQADPARRTTMAKFFLGVLTALLLGGAVARRQGPQAP